VAIQFSFIEVIQFSLRGSEMVNTSCNSELVVTNRYFMYQLQDYWFLETNLFLMNMQAYIQAVNVIINNYSAVQVCASEK
jgi:hypothetical protein